MSSDIFTLHTFKKSSSKNKKFRIIFFAGSQDYKGQPDAVMASLDSNPQSTSQKFPEESTDGMKPRSGYILVTMSNTLVTMSNTSEPGLIFGRFYSRYWVIFPIPKSIFFPKFWRKIPYFKSEKSSFLSWQKLA